MSFADKSALRGLSERMLRSKDYRNLSTRLLATVVDLAGRTVFFWIPKRRPQPADIRRLLIVKFDRIGDTFLSTPALEALRLHFPHAWIILLAAPWNREVLLNNPNLNELQVMPEVPNVHARSLSAFFRLPTILALKRRIDQIAPDLVIDLQGNPMNVLAMLLSNAHIRAGFSRKLLSFLLHCPLNYPDGIHQSEVYLSLARGLGFDGPPPELRVFTTEGVSRQVEELLAFHALERFTVLHLGAGHPYRQWPATQFSALANRILAENPAWKVVLIGGTEDEVLGQQLARESVAPDRLVNLIGKLSLSQLYCLLGHAGGFVGSESGPGHLAASTGIPTVFLVNSWAGIHRWRARGKRVTVLFRDVHPCRGVGCDKVPCPNMAAISVNEVREAVQEYLSQGPSR